MPTTEGVYSSRREGTIQSTRRARLSTASTTLKRDPERLNSTAILTITRRDHTLWSRPSLQPTSRPETLHVTGGWRGLEKLVLHPGWKSIPPPPPPTSRLQDGSNEPSWNVEHERLVYRFQKEEQRLSEMERTAKSVGAHLRAVRKSCGGRWIDVDLGHPV
jgi:hypothetical protein